MSASYQELPIAPLHDPFCHAQHEHATAVHDLTADCGAERQELGTDFSVKAKQIPACMSGRLPVQKVMWSEYLSLEKSNLG